MFNQMLQGMAPMAGPLAGAVANQQRPQQQPMQQGMRPPMPPQPPMPGMQGMPPQGMPPQGMNPMMGRPQPLPRIDPRQMQAQRQGPQQGMQQQQELQMPDLSKMNPMMQQFVGGLPKEIQSVVSSAASLLQQDSQVQANKPSNIPDTVHNAIRAGAGASGLPYNTLASIAQIESAMNPNAKAKTSSASGLFQFINSTWDSMVNKYGKQHGIGKGDKFDPRANAIMGGLYLKDNSKFLESRLGRQPSTSELYTAHFLGPGGAARVLGAADNTPISKVATQAQIRANPTLLRGTVGDFRNRIDNKINSAMEHVGLSND
jgi:soluble lytic murein transglycosylase-like protein